MSYSRVNQIRAELAQTLRGKSVLITGATGFVGSAIVREGIVLNDEFNAQLSLFLVSRENRTSLDSSWNKRHDISTIKSAIGDSIDCPNDLDVIFHCATPASAQLNAEAPLEMLNINIDAMHWILSSLASQTKTARLVFASSGAVYGPQPDQLSHIPEDYLGGPNVLLRNSAYAEGKRVAELLLAQAGHKSLAEPIFARLFAFSGIGLPLRRHYAIGNFVSNAISSESITIRGSGRDIRSYLDSHDMAIWLWATAARAKPFSPVHIGSERTITIAELAYLVSDIAYKILAKRPEVLIQNLPSPIDGASNYVPSTSLTRQMLGVHEYTSLEDSIEQMIRNTRQDD